MAKKKEKKSANIIKKSDLEEKYLKINWENKKFCVTLGRIIYVIRKEDLKNYKLHGYFDIRVRLEKGWWRIEHFPRIVSQDVYIFNEEDPIAYKEIFSDILKQGIEAGELYIKKKDKTVTYKKTDKPT